MSEEHSSGWWWSLKNLGDAVSVGVSCPAHRTGNVSDGDGATASPAQQEESSPVSSAGRFFLLPRQINAPQHVFRRLTSAVGETGSIFPLWKLFQGEEESQPAWCGWWEELQSPKTTSRTARVSVLTLAAPMESSSSPGLVNPCLCPVEQTGRLVRSIFHCKTFLSEPASCSQIPKTLPDPQLAWDF